MHTREIARYGGVATVMPKYALFFLLFTMGSVGLPGTSNFVGEFLSLTGAYLANSWVAFVATTGVILSAAYSLYLYARISYGEVGNDEVRAMPDLSVREIAILLPLGLATIWMGVYPESFMAPMRKDIGWLVTRTAPAAPAPDGQPTAGRPVPANHGAAAAHGPAAHGAQGESH
jgi:NADH-quinone oxidoreductase subunit M